MCHVEKSTDVSEEHDSSIFRAEEQSKQRNEREEDDKQGLLAVFYLPQAGSCFVSPSNMKMEMTYS
jgi:hypothetical protein